MIQASPPRPAAKPPKAARPQRSARTSKVSAAAAAPTHSAAVTHSATTKQAPGGAPAFARAAPEATNRRQSILLAAEKLFAQRGYHAVSMRDIAAEAQVPVALVSYHYGAKHELYHAIFESWLPSIRRRRGLLQAAMASDEALSLEAVLAAFVRPLVAMNSDPAGQYFAKMAARDLASPTPESEQAQLEFFDPMAHAFIDALQRLFPKRTRADVAWCYQFMLGAVLHHLSDVRVERLSNRTATAADPAREPMLLAFIAAGFRGALGEPAVTRKAARGRAGG
ncbi:MAG: TetR family transcriptional regulator [Rubrivivax sp.]|nr:TetR family transcriptional regulator [Rubrivivax sp.]